MSGTRDTYYVADLEGQLRETIVARMTDVFAASDVPFLDMTANQAALAQKIATAATPSFTALGLELNQFMVENISLPDELTEGDWISESACRWPATWGAIRSLRRRRRWGPRLEILAERRVRAWAWVLAWRWGRPWGKRWQAR